ncbi:hypothetical protein AWC38_SpisGene23732 [Stylophora pistillata]|uniref:Uncharacterized protein n=1 Tax=Stylophora pistillata TaxID=50429 RepID=A0A2B4R3Y8_STYPI|nr:hypothetical protein AWC38_SpisGene23732 [Stylophora pistillata]
MNRRYKYLREAHVNPGSNEFWCRYKQQQNKVKAMLRKAEAAYWLNLFENANSPGDFWKVTNHILKKNKIKKYSIGSGEAYIYADDTTIYTMGNTTDEVAIALQYANDMLLLHAFDTDDEDIEILLADVRGIRHFTMDNRKVREIAAENNAQLLSQIKDLVSTSVSDLKRSSDSNAAQQMSEIKRLKREAPPSFKKKSNENQYKANKAALEAVEDASAAVEQKDLAKAKEALNKGVFG